VRERESETITLNLSRENKFVFGETFAGAYFKKWVKRMETCLITKKGTTSSKVYFESAANQRER